PAPFAYLLLRRNTPRLQAGTPLFKGEFPAPHPKDIADELNSFKSPLSRGDLGVCRLSNYKLSIDNS
ncbi:MAG: hypothetical protein U9N45_01765, partial [Gemmatimonadota bacterium]|nr:hypothetical protein [Gemmatimonadota bacterium]